MHGLADLMFDMGNTDGGETLNRGEWDRLIDFYENWGGRDSWPVDENGEAVWDKIFSMMDFNGDGGIDHNELGNAMMRDGWSIEDMKWVWE